MPVPDLPLSFWDSYVQRDEEADVVDEDEDAAIAIIERERIRSMVNDACENYLTFLPNQLGCGLCQRVHTLVGSQSYQHYAERREQLLHMKTLLEEGGFEPERALAYLNEVMHPFHGRFGKAFYVQCKGLLRQVLGGTTK